MEPLDAAGGTANRTQALTDRGETMHKLPWFVRETKCYPCAWRVDSNHFRTDNSHVHFFDTEAEAQREADRRNALAEGRHWSEVAA